MECGAYVFHGKVICEDCSVSLRANNVIYEAVIKAKEKAIERLYAMLINKDIEILQLQAAVQSYKDDPFRAIRELGVHDAEPWYEWSST